MAATDVLTLKLMGVDSKERRLSGVESNQSSRQRMGEVILCRGAVMAGPASHKRQFRRFCPEPSGTQFRDSTVAAGSSSAISTGLEP